VILKTEEVQAEVVKMQQLTIDEKEASGLDTSTGLYDLCPECGGGSLAYEEGCRKCYACGYSGC
jgi:ribonucleoside-diphosphate reductase alpha chain